MKSVFSDNSVIQHRHSRNWCGGYGSVGTPRWAGTPPPSSMISTCFSLPSLGPRPFNGVGTWRRIGLLPVDVLSVCGICVVLQLLRSSGACFSKECVKCRRKLLFGWFCSLLWNAVCLRYVAAWGVYTEVISWWIGYEKIMLLFRYFGSYALHGNSRHARLRVYTVKTRSLTVMMQGAAEKMP